MSGWHDPLQAAAWDRVAAESPSRTVQLDLLLAVLERLAPASLLEVGIGSGLVAERVLERLPEARLVGVDNAAPMLDLARSRLDRFGDRVTLVRADLARPDAIEFGQASFDAAYSVQTLHHLPDPAKAEVYGWLGRVLPPGAFFLLRDKVTVPPSLFDAYLTVWEQLAVDMPPTAPDLADSLAAKGDVPGSLADQLAWLGAAGFEAGLLHAEAHYALVAARRR